MAVLNRTIQIDVLADKIRKHRYFASLSDERMAALAEEAACYAFVPEEMIFLDGEPSAGLWLLHTGEVKIFKCSPEGKEHILYVVGPGDSFNNIAALDGGPNPASACALSEVSACVLTFQTLQNAIRTDPELALTLIHFLADRTRMLVQQVEDLALYSVAARVARFLLKQMDNPTLSAPSLTRQTIASHLAIKPETLSRALSAMERSGVIACDRTTITVLREDLLRVIAMQ